MIYQPRQNGDACYTASISVAIKFWYGYQLHSSIEVLVRIRNRRRAVIVANWDVLPKYHHITEGGSFNVN